MKELMGSITVVDGVLASGVSAGIKGLREKDLALIFCREPAVAAGVFTTNLMKAPPVLLTQSRVKSGKAQAIVANSGNANACTGEAGFEDARRMAQITAEELKIAPEMVLVASTGVIGVRLPMDKIGRGIRQAVKSLNPKGGHDAARAIMTTDKLPKECAVSLEVSGKKVRIGGIAKGAGMIRPNMATMLCFLATDVSITAEMLQRALKESVDLSFNRITVDGNMSTNDTVLILATGGAGNPQIKGENEAYAQFRKGLDYVTGKLARMIVEDGEGATKLITVTVKGARNEREAEMAARAVAESSLVKTAVYGMDPNWGRVAAALGYSGAVFDPEKVQIWFDDLLIVDNGVATDYDEDSAKRAFMKNNLRITANLNAGDAEATIWTCDLTEEYIRINASYRS